MYLRVTTILLFVLLFVKVIFWTIWCWCRRKKRQQRRMLEAGQVPPAQPAVSSGATLPSNYNTQYWQPLADVQTFSATAPPAYETVSETGTEKQGLPPPDQTAFGAN